MLTLYIKRLFIAQEALEEKKKIKEDRLRIKNGILVLKGNKTQAWFSLLFPLL